MDLMTIVLASFKVFSIIIIVFLLAVLTQVTIERIVSAKMNKNL